MKTLAAVVAYVLVWLVSFLLGLVEYQWGGPVTLGVAVAAALGTSWWYSRHSLDWY